VKTTFGEPPALSVRWIIADLANALCVVENVRNIAGMPDSEYAMEIELLCEEILSNGKSIISEKEFQFGLLEEDDRNFSRKISSGHLLLPRYRIGGIDTFTSTLKYVMDDLYNAVGKRHIDDFFFDDFC
jgi:hypothetical protein